MIDMSATNTNPTSTDWSSPTQSFSDEIDPDAIGYVLDMTASYLLELAYGPYLLTVSPGLTAAARMASLYTYASHIRPVAITFSAWNVDPAAMTMVEAITLLMSSGYLEVNTGVPTGRRIGVYGSVTDRGQYDQHDVSQLPSRARMDTAYVRNRIASSVRQNREQILAGGDHWDTVIRTIANLAGGMWPAIAAKLLGGEA